MKEVISMLLMVIDSKGKVSSKELEDFTRFNMSIVSGEDGFTLKINDNYELYEKFSTEEDAIKKMAMITREANDY